MERLGRTPDLNDPPVPTHTLSRSSGTDAAHSAEGSSRAVHKGGWLQTLRPDKVGDWRVGEDRVRGKGRKGWLPAFRDAALFKVAYAYGLRRNETRMLDLTDFGRNPEGRESGEYGTLLVRYGKAKKGSPPKRRSVLTVWHWTPGTIEEWISEVRPGMRHSTGRALWPSERGPRIGLQRLDSRFAAYQDAIGLDPALEFHSLRRSYITHLIEDGHDPLFVQLLLSPLGSVHDVQHEPGAGGDLRGGGGYLPPSITQFPRRWTCPHPSLNWHSNRSRFAAAMPSSHRRTRPGSSPEASLAARSAPGPWANGSANSASGSQKPARPRYSSSPPSCPQQSSPAPSASTSPSL
ncbi:site-specific integrase [Streptomyces sp. NPDC048483]|uniref:tyrosine-type recombinase/integrase n=1 Tax=Streptomyces sp. NPDC048483 TaxID=3154927 RepID=UPI003444C48B